MNGLATLFNNFNAEFAENAESTEKNYIKTFSFLCVLCVLRELCVEVVNKFRDSIYASVFLQFTH
jgi:hypothetical protein